MRGLGLGLGCNSKGEAGLRMRETGRLKRNRKGRLERKRTAHGEDLKVTKHASRSSSSPHPHIHTGPRVKGYKGFMGKSIFKERVKERLRKGLHEALRR